MTRQQVRYCKTSDGFDIAFATYGSGPSLVVPPNILNTHLQMELSYPATRGFYERLSARVQIVRYDGRGTGMSQRGVVDFSVDAGVLDLLAVVDRLGLDRFTLYNHLMAGEAPLAFAGRHPSRVASVVWWVGQTIRISDEAQRQAQAMSTLMESHWDLYTNVMGRLVFGWDAPEATVYAEIAQAGTNPETRQAASEAMDRAWRSGTPPMSNLEAPTLVAHLAAAKASTNLARSIAAQLPNAHVLAIPGHTGRTMPFVDDNEVLIAAIADFVESTAATPNQPVPAPVLRVGAMRAILWTDVVGHTALIDRYGDDSGRELLREHERITRDQLEVHGGTEVKTMGDGFMTWFPSAQSAVDCAIALQRAFAERNATADHSLEIRAGVNAGEPIAEDDDLFGTSVIAAARICNEAQAGEIVVSDVVRQLTAGKGFTFADRGSIPLKGFQEPVRLHDVRWRG